MKAVVFRGIGEIGIEEVPEPEIREPTDAIVQIRTSAICGTDLHMVRGTLPGMKPGTVIGHEAVAVVQALGPEVRNLNVGDRVIVPSTIACGVCSYCRAGYYAQCDTANPHGKRAGTAFFGGPEASGPFDGLQAERARVPYAQVGLVKVPDEVSDDDAILLSDIFPTAWFGADLAEVRPGRTVAVFGCGPVGQLAIASAKLKLAGRVFAVDTVPSRLAMARAQGAEIIDYESEDPVEALVRLTGGIGVDCAIDAVGVDANHASRGPARQDARSFEGEVERVAPERRPNNGNWHPGDAPSQVLRWAVQALAKAGTLAIIGVYPPSAERFPIGEMMNKNLVVRAGNCNHRRYIPELLELVRAGAVHPSAIITQHQPLASAIEAFEAFDRREPGWVKVRLDVLAGPPAGDGQRAPGSSVHVAP
ncbi:MAG TPA: zinc-dependent alcohol dehydrogenase [Polyangia bacterium]|nr:zinc-dependent alcohol dehydrogenase [Polyangia bacterium]